MRLKLLYLYVNFLPTALTEEQTAFVRAGRKEKLIHPPRIYKTLNMDVKY